MFAEKFTRRDLAGLNIEASYYQSVNSIFIILIAPVFAWLWLRLARAKKEPPPDPTTKRCPECLSEIPIEARRCAFCGEVVGTHSS